MPQPNQIHVVLDDATLTEIQAAIDLLNAKLLPQLKHLSAQDRREIPKMGDKTTAFVQKAFEYAEIHPDLVPPYVDMGEFQVDLEALKTLQNLERQLEPLLAALSDSIMLSGSEGYQAALLLYHSLKSASKANIGASAQVYADLAARFPHNTAKPKNAALT